MEDRKPYLLKDQEVELLLDASLSLHDAGAAEQGLRLAYAGFAASEPERAFLHAVKLVNPSEAPMIATANLLARKGYPTEATTLLLDSAARDPESWRQLWETSLPVHRAGHLRQGMQARNPQGHAGTYSTSGGEGIRVRSRLTRGEPEPPEPIPRKHRSTPKPKPKAASGREFFFVLEGEGAYRNQVKLGSDVDLHFKYEVPVKELLAKVTGEQISRAKKKVETGNKLDIGVYVAPVGLEFREGEEDPYQLAHFRRGKMTNKVVFHLRAPQQRVEKVGLRVILTFHGAELYRTLIPLDLVDEISGKEAHPTPVNMSLSEVATSDSLPRDVTAYFQKKGGGAEYILTVTRKGEKREEGKTNYVDIGQLENVLQQVNDLMTKVAECRIFNLLEPEHWGPTEENAKGFRKAIHRVLTAGSMIHEFLTKCESTKELVKAIEELPDNGLVSIHTPDVFIPWEIVYPLGFSEDWPEQDIENNFYPKHLWGYRHEFETMLDVDLRDVKSPPTRTQPGPLEIRVGFGRTVTDAPGAKINSAKYHENYCKKNSLDTKFLGNSEEIKEVFHDKSDPGSLLYFICHGKNDGAGEELEFSSNFTAYPRTLTPGSYDRPPVIFLNSCSSGAIQPHNFTSFLEKFRQKGAYGVIAASFPLPIAFGTLYGCEFMDAYRNNRRLGEILLEMRRKLLDQENPLAFFYALQCPLDVRRPKVASHVG